MTATRRRPDGDLTRAVRPTTTIPAASAARTNASPSRTSVLPASIESPSTPAACIAGNRRDANDRHVETHVLRRLRHLHHARARAGERAGPLNGRVRAFHRFDGDDGAILDDDGLTDVETGNRVGDAIAEVEVGLHAL